MTQDRQGVTAELGRFPGLLFQPQTVLGGPLGEVPQSPSPPPGIKVKGSAPAPAVFLRTSPCPPPTPHPLTGSSRGQLDHPAQNNPGRDWERGHREVSSSELP